MPVKGQAYRKDEKGEEVEGFVIDLSYLDVSETEPG